MGNDAAASSAASTRDPSRMYIKEFKKVVEAADVIIQVLDARDPMRSRCPQVESAIISAGTSKRLVLLLNKVDLVPREVVEKPPQRVPDFGLQSLNAESEREFGPQQNLLRFRLRSTPSVCTMSRSRGPHEATRQLQSVIGREDGDSRGRRRIS